MDNLRGNQRRETEFKPQSYHNVEEPHIDRCMTLAIGRHAEQVVSRTHGYVTNWFGHFRIPARSIRLGSDRFDGRVPCQEPFEEVEVRSMIVVKLSWALVYANFTADADRQVCPMIANPGLVDLLADAFGGDETIGEIGILGRFVSGCGLADEHDLRVAWGWGDPQGPVEYY